MEIVIFDKTWQEIPEQDNPALHYVGEKGNKHRAEPCLMIFKGKHMLISDGGLVVALVPINGDITKLGVFWTLENALLFSRSYREEML